MTGPGGLDETFGKLSSRHNTASEVALLFAGSDAYPEGHAYRSQELQRTLERLLDDYHLLKRLRRWLPDLLKVHEIFADPPLRAGAAVAASRRAGRGCRWHGSSL